MCLSVPARIISINGHNAIVDINGNKLETNIQMIDNPLEGDYVLVHAGFAIEKISEEEAQASLDLFDEFDEFQNNPDNY